MIASGKGAQTRRAAVVGAGPNGLAAAIVLARAGLQVEVFEAEPQAGGAARTLPLTLPGFLHDFGSAVHPMAAGSPFFLSLPLHNYGLEWIHSPAPLAHPLDDGTAVMLERDLGDAEAALGEDGKQWRRLIGPFAERWKQLAPEILRPVHLLTRHPFLLARLGLLGFPSAIALSQHWFRNPRTKALFAGLAAHSILALGRASKRFFWPGARCCRACRRMAHSARRRAVYHRRTVRASRSAWRHGEDFHSNRQSQRRRRS